MGRRGKFRTNYSGPPARGTKNNIAFRLMLRGATAPEIRAASGFAADSHAGVLADSLRDMCGYDVRFIKRAGEDHGVYVIVGRHKWGGGYVSFVDGGREALRQSPEHSPDA